MEDKYYIRDKVRSILMEDPSLFPAFKASFVDAKTISHVIYKYPNLIAHVKILDSSYAKWQSNWSQPQSNRFRQNIKNL